MKEKIVFTITNNISYDQRMQKICTTLAGEGYDVLLVGVAKFLPLESLLPQPFRQKRLGLFIKQGPLSFVESNLRMFFYLLFKNFDVIGAIDLDTIIPVYLLSVIKKKKRVYDAHELFCETHSVVSKPLIYKIWKFIEKTFLPRFRDGYTVNQSLSDEFSRMYGLNYQLVMNAPLLKDRSNGDAKKDERIILYQGVVNHGRGFQFLVPAMKQVNAKMVVCGDGNYLETAKQAARQQGLDKKIEFKGFVLPQDLVQISNTAYIGVTPMESKGKSYYLSLPNRFFDYMHAGLPQVAMNYPEYRRINEQIKVAVLIDTLDESSLANAINLLLNDQDLYDELKSNCRLASQQYNWQQEEKKLIAFYKKLCSPNTGVR